MKTKFTTLLLALALAGPGIAKAGPGMLIGAVTTMMAFLMTTTIEFTAYSELGVITAGSGAFTIGASARASYRF